MKLRFPPGEERAFRADYGTNTLTHVRFGLLVGAALYALFALLDIWMLPVTWPVAHLIRFAIVLPVCLAALGLTLWEHTRRHLQLLVTAFITFAGLGIVVMIALAQEAEPGFRYYYAGLLLVLPYSFTVLRLRFLPTAISSTVIILGYELVAILDQRLLARGLFDGWGPVFLNNNFFLLGAGFITLTGAYALESYSRSDFRQRKELADALEELRAMQTQLIQSERTAAMSNVVAGLLHELNNPVGAIASAVDVVTRGTQRLQNEPERPDREKTASLIADNITVLRDATQRVKNTLEVLKRFSRVDQAEIADYDVNAALADCASLLAHETTERIAVYQHLGTLPKIRCHPSEINQLFMSLLKNAIESIRDSGTVEVRTSASDGSVRIDIKDTGMGIEEDQLKDLFVPKFSRASTRVKLGLGLMTSQNIVQRHWGTIDIQSRVGEGTRVSITLPQKL